LPASDLHPGDEVAVNLIWRALTPIDADYSVTVQLLSPQGQVYGQRDAFPLKGGAPTSSWTPGEVVDDAYRLALAPNVPAGEYQLIVAMYLPETGERLPARGDGDAVTLGRLEIMP
jgi:hypothetical protein